MISPLDLDLALVYPRLLPVALGRLLRERGIQCLEAGDEEFQASNGLNLNVLATGPRRCIAVGGFPQTARLLREAGCEVTCFEADALCLPCEGGPTCLTLPVWRGWQRPVDDPRVAPRAALQEFEKVDSLHGLPNI